MKKKPIVFVGVSGGVDSSVSAALLKEEGFTVVGVFMKTWQPDFIACTWKEERLDAMRVCAHLDIPFLTFDLEEEYKRGVADYMIEEYRKGRTPNPDVMCNREVKFGAFLRKAKEMGADYVATGHYVQKITENGVEHLHMGVDKEKDQSYFLWTLGQEELVKTLFPVGKYEKSEVRTLAKKFGLPTATKKDSQGVCFIGKLDMKEFLKHYIPEKHGDVLDTKGSVIGRHDGAHLYTLGERHGFLVTNKEALALPKYVVSKDMERNTITVSSEPVPEERMGTLMLEEVNWISRVPETGRVYMARIRYRQELFSCTLEAENDGTARVSGIDKNMLVSRGQSMVLYEGTECLGGGIVR